VLVEFEVSSLPNNTALVGLAVSNQAATATGAMKLTKGTNVWESRYKKAGMESNSIMHSNPPLFTATWSLEKKSNFARWAPRFLPSELPEEGEDLFQSDCSPRSTHPVNQNTLAKFSHSAITSHHCHRSSCSITGMHLRSHPTARVNPSLPR
jgi:hypothetical protein